MKLSGRRIEAFLHHPPPGIRAVLLYGPDGGLARERVESLIRSVVPDPADPFRVVDLNGAALDRDPARLADEAAAITFGGGRRVIVIGSAGDGQTAVLRGFLKTAPGDALVIATAAELGSRSSLRSLFERADNGAAMGCYRDNEGELEVLIESVLGADGLTAEPEAVAFLVGQLGADRQISRRELEKLTIYMGAGCMAAGSGHMSPVVSLADAQACVGDVAATSLEDAAFAVAAGDIGALELTLARCYLEGANAVSVLRAVARHFQRLHLAAAALSRGGRAAAALATLRPPVFYKHISHFHDHLTKWPTARVGDAIEVILETEVACKSTRAPQKSLCGRALLMLADWAREQQSRHPAASN